MPGRDGPEGIAQATQAPVRDECNDPWHEERDGLVFSQDLSDLAVDPVHIVRVDCARYLVDKRINFWVVVSDDRRRAEVFL